MSHKHDESASGFPDAWLRLTSIEGGFRVQSLGRIWSLQYSSLAMGLLYWSGFAAMAGSAIWLLLVIVQTALNLPTDSNLRLLAAPASLLVLALAALHIQHVRSQTWICWSALLLAVLALALVTCGFAPNLWIYSHSGVVSFFGPSSVPYYIVSFLLSGGLVLFGITASKRRVLPNWGLTALVIAVWALNMVDVIWYWGWDPFLGHYAMLVGLSYYQDFLPVAALVFGLSSLWLGYTLWSKNRQAIT
jgi:hypothetical protein